MFNQITFNEYAKLNTLNISVYFKPFRLIQKTKHSLVKESE